MNEEKIKKIQVLMRDMPCRKDRCDYWDVQGNYCYADSSEQVNCPMGNEICQLFERQLSPLGETTPLSERLPEEIFNRIHDDAGKFMTSWNNGEYDYLYAADVALELCRFIADKLDEARENAPLPRSIQEALNSGDGVYRP